MIGLFYLILFLTLLVIALAAWYGLIFGSNVKFGELNSSGYIYANFESRSNDAL